MKNICLIVCKLQVTHFEKTAPFGLFIAGAHAAYIVATGATYSTLRSWFNCSCNPCVWIMDGIATSKSICQAFVILSPI